MRAVRMWALGAATAATIGATAASPAVARADDTATCDDGAWKLCKHVVGCYEWQDDACAAPEDTFFYWKIQPQT